MNHQTVYTIHGVFEDRLAEIKAEMLVKGAPVIRVVDCHDYLQALEGVHRLRAACELGIAPEWIILEQDDLVEADSLDWQDLCSGKTYPAGELAGEVYTQGSGSYHINEDGTLKLMRAGGQR